MAHQNIRPAKVIYTEGEIHDANINRSPTAYQANPKKERDMYVSLLLLSQMNIRIMIS